MRCALALVFVVVLLEKALAHPLDHPVEMFYKGATKFSGDKIDRIHVNGSAILDGTKVEIVVKIHGNLEAFAADIYNLKLHGSGHLKNCTVHVRARVRGDLNAEDTVFQNGITGGGGHLILSHVTSGPIEFQSLADGPLTQKLTLTNGTVINGSVTFEKGAGEIVKDKTSSIKGQIIGNYTLKEI